MLIPLEGMSFHVSQGLANILISFGALLGKKTPRSDGSTVLPNRLYDV